MNKTQFDTAGSERISYYSYFVGQNIIYMIVSSFIGVYMITTLGIAAATAGTILLVVRIFDSVSDPLFSVVVEKSKLKGGKFRPWINAVSIAVPIVTVLIFSFTNFMIESSIINERYRDRF